MTEPVVSHDKPGGADHSTNDRDVLLRANSVLFTGLNPGYLCIKLKVFIYRFLTFDHSNTALDALVFTALIW